MPLAEFEPAAQEGERPQTHALELAATGICRCNFIFKLLLAVLLISPWWNEFALDLFEIVVSSRLKPFIHVVSRLIIRSSFYLTTAVCYFPPPLPCAFGRSVVWSKPVSKSTSSGAGSENIDPLFNGKEPRLISCITHMFLQWYRLTCSRLLVAF
jgi:hypothetical protein